MLQNEELLLMLGRQSVRRRANAEIREQDLHLPAVVKAAAPDRPARCLVLLRAGE